MIVTFKKNLERDIEGFDEGQVADLKASIDFLETRLVVTKLKTCLLRIRELLKGLF